MEKGTYSDYKCYCCKPEEIKMIELGSKSYPYLAVAQHYGIDYGEVFDYLHWLENRVMPPLFYQTWHDEVKRAYKSEMERRKQVLKA